MDATDPAASPQDTRLAVKPAYPPPPAMPTQARPGRSGSVAEAGGTVSGLVISGRAHGGSAEIVFAGGVAVGAVVGGRGT